MFVLYTKHLVQVPHCMCATLLLNLLAYSAVDMGMWQEKLQRKYWMALVHTYVPKIITTLH